MKSNDLLNDSNVDKSNNSVPLNYENNSKVDFSNKSKLTKQFKNKLELNLPIPLELNFPFRNEFKESNFNSLNSIVNKKSRHVKFFSSMNFKEIVESCFENNKVNSQCFLSSSYFASSIFFNLHRGEGALDIRNIFCPKFYNLLQESIKGYFQNIYMNQYERQLYIKGKLNLIIRSYKINQSLKEKAHFSPKAQVNIHNSIFQLKLSDKNKNKPPLLKNELHRITKIDVSPQISYHSNRSKIILFEKNIKLNNSSPYFVANKFFKRKNSESSNNFHEKEPLFLHIKSLTNNLRSTNKRAFSKKLSYLNQKPNQEEHKKISAVQTYKKDKENNLLKENSLIIYNYKKNLSANFFCKSLIFHPIDKSKLLLIEGIKENIKNKIKMNKSIQIYHSKSNLLPKIKNIFMKKNLSITRDNSFFFQRKVVNPKACIKSIHKKIDFKFPLEAANPQLLPISRFKNNPRIIFKPIKDNKKTEILLNKNIKVKSNSTFHKAPQISRSFIDDRSLIMPKQFVFNLSSTSKKDFSMSEISPKKKSKVFYLVLKKNKRVAI